MSEELNGVLDGYSEIEGVLESDNTIEVDLNNIEVIGTTDHSKLSNRELPDQHPIDSITGLREALDEAMDNGADKTYVHIQGSSSDEWHITHGLNKFPSVTIIDSAGSLVTGDIAYVSENEVILSFSGAFSGKAFLN